MNYWPGTDIPKSAENAFDWREKPSSFATTHDWKSAESARRKSVTSSKKPFTTYSKAKASK
jgi:hypothetical protein